MGKKIQTIGEAMWARIMASDDEKAEQARTHRLTGPDMRQAIDSWNVPYTRVAGWLGLTVDGLHKQMRGDRPISAQTWLLFNRLAAGFNTQASMMKDDTMQWPDTPAFRSKARAHGGREARKLGLCQAPPFRIATRAGL